jgi:hypothetical protein
MNQTIERRKHPQADSKCRHCAGSGYLKLEQFDPFSGELSTTIEVCQCVLAAREHRNGK